MTAIFNPTQDYFNGNLIIGFLNFNSSDVDLYKMSKSNSKGRYLNEYSLNE